MYSVARDGAVQVLLKCAVIFFLIPVIVIGAIGREEGVMLASPTLGFALGLFWIMSLLCIVRACMLGRQSTTWVGLILSGLTLAPFLFMYPIVFGNALFGLGLSEDELRQAVCLLAGIGMAMFAILLICAKVRKDLLMR